MKTLLISLLVCSIASTSFADEASHRALASKVVLLSGAKEGMKGGFLAVIDPMINGLKQRGLPEAGSIEMKTAIVEWFDTEVKWEELEPKMVDIYVKEFTEPELQDMITFYETPTGRKALARLAPIVQQSAEVGQQYFTGKQESLTKRIQPILEKYKQQE